MASARHGTTWPRQWPTDSVQVATLASARDSVRGPALPRADPAQVPHDCSPRPMAAPTLATPARKTKTRPDPARAGEQCLSFIPFAQGPERGDPENPTPMATQVRRPGPHAALPASPRVGCARPFQRCSAGARRCSAAALQRNLLALPWPGLTLPHARSFAGTHVDGAHGRLDAALVVVRGCSELQQDDKPPHQQQPDKPLAAAAAHVAGCNGARRQNWCP